MAATGENNLENVCTDAGIRSESVTFTPVGATPLSVAAPLFATDLAAMGLFSWMATAQCRRSDWLVETSRSIGQKALHFERQW